MPCFFKQAISKTYQTVKPYIRLVQTRIKKQLLSC